MDPWDGENQHLKIFLGAPSEIATLRILRLSHGTEKKVKFFLISCSNNVILCILPTYDQKRTENSIMAKVNVTMGNIVQMVGIF